MKSFKKKQVGFTITEFVICLWMLFVIGMVVTIGYVGIHFINKLW